MHKVAELGHEILMIQDGFRHYQTRVSHSQPSDDCCVCMSQKRTHVLNPCGHFVLCEECSQLCNGLCPICKTQYTAIIKVYTSWLTSFSWYTKLSIFEKRKVEQLKNWTNRKLKIGLEEILQNNFINHERHEFHTLWLHLSQHLTNQSTASYRQQWSSDILHQLSQSTDIKYLVLDNEELDLIVPGYQIGTICKVWPFKGILKFSMLIDYHCQAFS